MCYNDINSDTLDIICHVPHDNILTPNLFILYLNDMVYVIELFNVQICADGTNMFAVILLVGLPWCGTVVRIFTDKLHYFKNFKIISYI